MSMPSFPPNGADLTREEALTMIIASIAMEELALSHILNAEGEKLQYILGTLPGTSSCTCTCTCTCTCPQDVLAVNKSVTALVEAVTQTQILLKNKLAQVLEFCPRPSTPDCKQDPPPAPCSPPPCPAPCPVPHCEKSAVQLVSQQERMLWNPGCRLPWRLRCCSGNSIGWDGHTPAQIQLSPEKTYVVQYTMNICVTTPVEGAILLRQSPCLAFTDPLPLCFSVGCSQQTLHYASVLRPSRNNRCSAELSLVLDAKAPVCVERAVLDIMELVAE
ncbi:MAG: hypothetical protein HFF96_07465 [Oscillibacter sp.]|nr:hypothetical protein [Oscillibacter sp.]